MQLLDHLLARNSERLCGRVEVEAVARLVLHLGQQGRLAAQARRARDPVALGAADHLNGRGFDGPASPTASGIQSLGSIFLASILPGSGRACQILGDASARVLDAAPVHARHPDAGGVPARVEPDAARFEKTSDGSAARASPGVESRALESGPSAEVGILPRRRRVSPSAGSA
jgi:hypothetical protein